MATKKNKLQNSLYQSDWMNYHPFHIVCKSDYYYIKLSNKILNEIETIFKGDKFSSEVKRKMAVTVTAYFEDVISQLGLWKALLAIYKAKFNKILPFFDMSDEDYFEDEINQKDIQFLIWCILQRDNIDYGDDEVFINPENPLIELVAFATYAILDSEYETAPENIELYNLIHTADLPNNFFLFRELLSWLHYDSYLSMSYPTEAYESEKQTLNNSGTDNFIRENKRIVEYTIRKVNIFSKNSTPFAIKTAEWMAEIAPQQAEKEIIKEIDFKQINNYTIVDTNETYITVHPFNNENEILKINLNSIENPPKFDAINLIMCSLVYFNKYWHVNGFASFGFEDKIKKNEDVEEQNKINNRKTVEKLLKETNNKPIAYFKNYIEYQEFINKIFGQIVDNSSELNKLTNFTNILFFSHPEIGFLIFPTIAIFIKDKDNPYYDEKVAKKDSLGLLLGNYQFPKELLDYIIANDLLPDAAINSLKGAEYGRKLVQENMEFIVRFFQPEIFSKKG
jgi:hypothetical protein